MAAGSASRAHNRENALMAVIGDAVGAAAAGRGGRARRRHGPVTRLTALQDTVTGFLLAGVGDVNAKRQANFLVVDKSTPAAPAVRRGAAAGRAAG